MPNDQAHTTLDYLGHTVIKNIANYIADFKGKTLQQEGQINQLKNMLIQDPCNMQALDALEKAANEGIELAKKALEELAIDRDAIVLPSNVLPVKQTAANGNAKPDERPSA